MPTTLEPYEIAVPSLLAFNPELTDGDLRIYMALTHFNRGGLERPTHNGIAELAGVSRSYIGPSLARLEEAGAITIDRSAAPHAIHLAA
jgi:DNA-binding MarR family transcriptional regulator